MLNKIVASTSNRRPKYMKHQCFLWVKNNTQNVVIKVKKSNNFNFTSEKSLLKVVRNIFLKYKKIFCEK